MEDNDVSTKDFAATVTELPSGHIVYEQKRQSLEGNFRFETDLRSTHYSVCFRNDDDAADSDDEAEEEKALNVGFSVRVTDVLRAEDGGEVGPETEKVSTLLEHAADIHESWEVMLDHLDYSHNREAIYEELASSILHRLTKWTYIEAFLVIGMATGQVMYWKKFFETKRYL